VNCIKLYNSKHVFTINKNKIQKQLQGSKALQFSYFNSLLYFHPPLWRERFRMYETNNIYEVLTIEDDDNFMNMRTISEDAKECLWCVFWGYYL
jgi:hypothetical protein